MAKKPDTTIERQPTGCGSVAGGRPTKAMQAASKLAHDERKRQISELRVRGLSWSSIADRIGCSRSTVMQDWAAWVSENFPPGRQEEIRSLMVARNDADRARALRYMDEADDNGETPDPRWLALAMKATESTARMYGMMGAELPAVMQLSPVQVVLASIDRWKSSAIELEPATAT